MYEYLLNYDINDTKLYVNPCNEDNYFFADFLLFKSNGLNPFRLYISLSSKNNNTSYCGAYFNLSVFNKLSFGNNSRILTDSRGNVKEFLHIGNNRYKFNDEIIEHNLSTNVHTYIDKYNNKMYFSNEGVSYPYKIESNNVEINLYFNNNGSIDYIKSDNYYMSFEYNESGNIRYIKYRNGYLSNPAFSQIFFGYHEGMLVNIRRELNKKTNYYFSYDNNIFSVKSNHNQIDVLYSNNQISYVKRMYKDSIDERIYEYDSFSYNASIYYINTHTLRISKTTIEDNMSGKFTYLNYENNRIKLINDNRRYYQFFSIDNSYNIKYETSIIDIKAESLISDLTTFTEIPYEDDDETYDFDVNTLSAQEISSLSIDSQFNINQVYKIEGCGSLVLNKDIYVEKDENLKIILIAKKDNGWFSITLKENQNMSYILSKSIIDISSIQFEVYILEIKTKKYVDNIEIDISVDGLSYIADLKLLKGNIGSYYTYDNNFNITKIESSDEILEYTYNNLNQLIKEENSESSIHIEYEYDSYYRVTDKYSFCYNVPFKHVKYFYEDMCKYKIKKELTFEVIHEDEIADLSGYVSFSYNNISDYYEKLDKLTKYSYERILYQNDIYYYTDNVIEKCNITSFKNSVTIDNYENNNQIEGGYKQIYSYKENTQLEYEKNYYIMYDSTYRQYHEIEINRKDYTYDNSNRITKLELNQDSLTDINYYYNTDNEYSSLSHINDYIYNYDLGLLSNVKYKHNNNEKDILNISYDNSNRIIRKNDFEFEYSLDNKLSCIKKYNTSNVLYSYTYDNIDRLISDSIYAYTYDENRIIKTYNSKQYVDYKNGYKIDNLFSRSSKDMNFKSNSYYVGNTDYDNISMIRYNVYYKNNYSTVDFYPLTSDFYNSDYSKYPISIKDNGVGYNEFVYDEYSSTYAYLAYGSMVKYKYETNGNSIYVSFEAKIENIGGARLLIHLDINKLVTIYIESNYIKLKEDNSNYNTNEICLNNFDCSKWHKFEIKINCDDYNYLTIDGINHQISQSLTARSINYITLGKYDRYGLIDTHGLIKNLIINNTPLNSYKEISKAVEYNKKGEAAIEVYNINSNIYMTRENNFEYEENKWIDRCMIHNIILDDTTYNIFFEYHYNYHGNITKINISGNRDYPFELINVDINYYYDNYNRLIVEDNHMSYNVRRYFYDSKNNLIGIYTINRTNNINDALNASINDMTSSSLISNMTFDNYNRLQSYNVNVQSSIYNGLNSNTFVVTYDNMLPTMITNNDDFIMSFEYISNRLKKVVKTKKDRTDIYCYEYNCDGLRIRKCIKNINNEIIEDYHFYYDNNENLIKEEREINNNTITIDYLYDNNEIYGYIYNNDVYYYLKDKLGFIYAITNSTGEVIEQYYMNSYGILNPDYHIEPDTQTRLKNYEFTTTLNINRIIYKGYYYDSEIGMYYLKNRYYNPYTGLFLTPDNINYIDFNNHLNYNLYTYCLNNPVMFSDPDGNGIIYAIIVGLIIGLATELASDLLDGNGLDHSWKDYLCAGVSGIIGVLAGELQLNMIGSLLFSMFGDTVGGLISGSFDSWEDYGKAKLTSALVSIFSYGYSKAGSDIYGNHQYNKIRGYSKNNTKVNKFIQNKFAKYDKIKILKIGSNTKKEFLKELKQTTSNKIARDISGGTVSVLLGMWF